MTNLARLVLVILTVVLVGVVASLYQASISHNHMFTIDFTLGCGQITVILDSQSPIGMSSCYNSAPNGGEPSWSYTANRINVTLTASSPSSDTILNVYKDGTECFRIQAGDHSTVPPRYPQTVSATC